MKKFVFVAALLCATTLAGCNGRTEPQGDTEETGHKEEDGAIILSDAQIRSAGITVASVSMAGSGGAVTLATTIEADPQNMHVVTAAIGGRLVAMNRNLGQAVRRGDPIATIESREAAQLNGEVQAAQARHALARSVLAREQRLFAERVSAEQDLIAARTAATEAGIALRLAQQQVAATGRAVGGMNRISLPSPIAGQVIARTGTLGQVVAADAELYRIANLGTVSLTLSLSARDAALIAPGGTVSVSAQGRARQAQIRFISPVVDRQTGLVPVIVALDNRDGAWRVGEMVSVSVPLAAHDAGQSIVVPQVAVQTVDGAPSIFVRTPTGFRAVAIETGQVSGENIVILKGLKGGERIATTGSFTLKAELGKGEAEHGH